MGLSAAWALAHKGARVTLVDQARLPNPLGASVDQHRLIRYAYGAERGYTRMVNDAYRAWDEVWRDIGARLYAPTGTLVLETSAGRWAEDSEATLAAEGIAFRRLSAGELAREFPLVAPDGVRFALHLDSGGMLFARHIVGALAAHLPAMGVAVHEGQRVTKVTPDKAQVTLDDGSVVSGDILIVAAGPWTTRLLPSLGRRITPSRQVVVYLAPPEELQPAWETHPMVLDIDPETGFYLVPPRRLPNGEPTDLKIGNHGFTLTGDPDRDREAGTREIAGIAALGPARLRDFDRFRVVEAKTCFYDVEANEHFIVEPLARHAWVMTGFSGHGFKFGPLLGHELARTLAGEREVAEFSRWAAGASAVLKEGAVAATRSR